MKYFHSIMTFQWFAKGRSNLDRPMPYFWLYRSSSTWFTLKKLFREVEEHDKNHLSVKFQVLNHYISCYINFWKCTTDHFWKNVKITQVWPHRTSRTCSTIRPNKRKQIYLLQDFTFQQVISILYVSTSMGLLQETFFRSNEMHAQILLDPKMNFQTTILRTL